MAAGRRRSDEYSATMVVRLASIVPMPSPVMNRAAISSSGNQLQKIAREGAGDHA